DPAPNAAAPAFLSWQSKVCCTVGEEDLVNVVTGTQPFWVKLLEIAQSVPRLVEIEDFAGLRIDCVILDGKVLGVTERGEVVEEYDRACGRGVDQPAFHRGSERFPNGGTGQWRSVLQHADRG